MGRVLCWLGWHRWRIEPRRVLEPEFGYADLESFHCQRCGCWYD